MRLPKDFISGNYLKPRIFLCEVDKERICQLETTNTNGVLKFNAYSELSFDVARTYNDLISGQTKVNPYYNKIESPRLIELEGLGYFELQGPDLVSDGIKEQKSCTAYSLEYTLSTKYLSNFKVNTGETGSIEVTYAEDVLGDINKIQPVTLYNPSIPELSLLHIVFKSIYGWRIGHVDAALCTLGRQFDVDRESVYDFLMNDVCEKFNCYIVFDTINNTINVYAESLTAKFIGDGKTDSFVISPPFEQIGTVSVGGYKTTRWEYNASTGTVKLEDVPEAGAHIEVVDGALKEWETDVLVNFDNLSREININYEADAIKTQLTVTYGDDFDIRDVNLGLPYLTDLSYYYTVDWMGQDLYDAYTAYMQKSNDSQLEYTNNSQEILTFNDKIYYEENRLSLEFSLAQSVNSTTVGTYYVRQENFDGTFYYKEVSLPSEYNANETYYSNMTTNVTEDKMSDLYDVLKKYFNNENTDDNSGNTKLTSWKTDLDELSSEFEFMNKNPINLSYLSTELSKVEVNRIGNSTAETAINNFLAEIWPELGRTPLTELYLKPYQQIKDTNIQHGMAQPDSEDYPYYYPVTLYISSIETAIAQRTAVIEEYQAQRKVVVDENYAISSGLAMDQNFTEQQLIRLSAFIREDELQLDDIVETEQDDLSSSFKVKQDAMESGRIELQKICQPQLKFSMTMANIYAIPAFEPIVDQFQLGKVIKVALRPDYIKQSRLLQININFDDFSSFSCEFGDLTSLRSQSDIHADLLKNAITAGKSVATNSGHWSRGSDIASEIELRIQQGLLDSTTKIKAMDATQGTVIDKYGIHLREVNPTTGEFSPEQGWITNNKFLYSDDGFKTAKSVFGRYTYGDNSYYGILAEALVGKLLIGTQMELGNESGTMTFNAGGLMVKNDVNNFNVNPSSEKLLTLSNEDGDVLYVDDKGQLHVSGDGAGLDIQANSSITGLQTQVEVTAEGLKSKVSSDEIISTINQSAEEVKIAAPKITLEGIVTANEHFKILEDGSMETNAGTIGGWTIKENYLGTVGSNPVFISQSGCEAWSDNFIHGYGNFLIYAKDKFLVDVDGKLYAKDAKISGVIEATSGGSIGGWDIGDNSIQKTVTRDLGDGNGERELTTGMQQPGVGTFAFAAGSPNASDWSGSPFRVTHGGKLYATGAEINGIINATTGQLGNWLLGANTIKSITTVDGKTRITGLQHTATGAVALAIGATSDELWDTAPFYVFHTGEMHASSGQIAGWNINSNYLGKRGASDNTFVLSYSGETLWSDKDNKNYDALVYIKDKFIIDTSGNLRASDASITGHIQATSGSFGEWHIDNYWLTSLGTGSENSKYGVGFGFDQFYVIDPAYTENTPSTSWLSVYQTCVTNSDIRLKHSVEDMSSKYDMFFDSLKPKMFKYTKESGVDNPNTVHLGFIAQDVANSLEVNNIQCTSFVWQQKDLYNLNKQEFIALNTWQIQKLKKRVAELEEKLAALE